MKKLVLLVFFLNCFIAKAQSDKIELKTYSFSEVEKLHQQNPKPILVFVYTDWCKICHGMKKNTFANSKVVSILNNKFYTVMLNGEGKNDITFLGKTFKYKPNGNSGVHELAYELASKKKRIGYPTTVILNTKFEIDLQFVGYMNSKKMNRILNKYKYKNSKHNKN